MINSTDLLSYNKDFGHLSECFSCKNFKKIEHKCKCRTPCCEECFRKIYGAISKVGSFFICTNCMLKDIDINTIYDVTCSQFTGCRGLNYLEHINCIFKLDTGAKKVYTELLGSGNCNFSPYENIDIDFSDYQILSEDEVSIIFKKVKVTEKFRDFEECCEYEKSDDSEGEYRSSESSGQSGNFEEFVNVGEDCEKCEECSDEEVCKRKTCQSCKRSVIDICSKCYLLRNSMLGKIQEYQRNEEKEKLLKELEVFNLKVQCNIMYENLEFKHIHCL